MTFYVGKTAAGRTITRSSTRRDFTHAAVRANDAPNGRIPSFGTSAEGALTNFYGSHPKTATAEVVPVAQVDAATYRAAKADPKRY